MYSITKINVTDFDEDTLMGSVMVPVYKECAEKKGSSTPSSRTTLLT